MRHCSIRAALLGGIVGIAGLAAAAGSADAAEVTLKLHHFLPPVAPAHAKMLAPWAEKVQKESNGRIKIDIFPAMQLGGAPPQLIDQVRDGVADIVWTLPGYTPGRFPKIEVFELPFMHSTAVATNKALWDFEQKHGDEFKAFKIIAYHVHAGQLFHSATPIRKVDDIKGLKIRTPTRTGGWLIEAMGATPVGAPVPKIPEMLSKRVVDAVLIPYEVTIPLKVHEMVDFHITLDDPIYQRLNTSVFVIAMNKAKYDSLAPDLKKVIDNNSGASQSEWIGKVWTEIEGPGEKLAASSGELIKLPKAEVAKLRKLVEQPVADRWIAEVKGKGVDGAALYKEARALLEKYSK